jgi:Domain of unknown function (DUF4382)
MRTRRLVGGFVAICITFLSVACNSGVGNSFGSGGGSGSTVNLHLSDPPTCSSTTGGLYSHVYVTIAKVQIHASAAPADNDPGWITLVDLTSAPQQVDLLGTASSQCFLADLGSASLQPGTYQQIRLVLAANNAAVANNQCGTAGTNCVVLDSDPNNPQQLQIPSGVQTGIKIPPGRIAGGQFTIAQGQTKDLNIDFDACASVVVQGNNQYRLKPTLFAGEVSLTGSSISGKVIDNATGLAIPGGKVLVALQQRSTTDPGLTGVQVTLQTATDAQGNFDLCPVPAGTYDVVVAAEGPSGETYAPTITTGVQPGNALGNVRVFALSGNPATGSIAGKITTQNPSSAAAPTDVTLAAFQTYNLSGMQANFVIPLVYQSNSNASTTATLATAADAACQNSNVACALYTLALPPSNAAIGAFAASGTTYSAPDFSTTPSYTVRGQPALACTPATDTAGPYALSAGGTVQNADLDFTSCQ